MVKREKESSTKSNSKLIWIIIIIAIIAIAAIILLKQKANPLFSPTDDLIGRSLTLKYGTIDALKTIIDKNLVLLDIFDAFLLNSDAYPIDNRVHSASISLDPGSSDDSLILTTFGKLLSNSPDSYKKATIALDGNGENIKLNVYDATVPTNSFISIDKGKTTVNKDLFVEQNLQARSATVNNNLQTKSISYSATPNDKFREVWGSVSVTGAKTGGSAGWTVSRSAKGVYKITLSPAFASGRPTPIVTLEDKKVPSVSSVTTSGFTVNVYGLGGEAQDAPFNLLVRGPA